MEFQPICGILKPSFPEFLQFFPVTNQDLLPPVSLHCSQKTAAVPDRYQEAEYLWRQSLEGLQRVRIDASFPSHLQKHLLQEQSLFPLEEVFLYLLLQRVLVPKTAMPFPHS